VRHAGKIHEFALEMATAAKSEIVLEIKNLCNVFLQHTEGELKAVDGLSYNVNKGERRRTGWVKAPRQKRERRFR